MEKLCTMLNRRQLMLIKKEFSDKVSVTDDTILELVNQVEGKKYYREIGTPHRWQFDFRDGVIIGVHRQLNYFATI